MCFLDASGCFEYISLIQVRRRPLPSQLAFADRPRWGGRRAGAGRKPGKGRRNTPHRALPVHKHAHPLHVTLRARGTVGSLRQGHIFASIKESISEGQKDSFRIVHFSVQGDHIHFVVEAADERALASGVRGLSIRIARSVNKLLGRKGQFWADRYHSRALKTPREVRNVLVYVLMNHKHHGRRSSAIDARSSAPWFDGFTIPLDAPPDPPVRPPRTWLASRGWRRHGLIDPSEAPARQL
jgi:putative transposase